MAVEASVRALVRRRAQERCEYCRKMQVESPLVPLQIEHIIPKKHGGGDQEGNLALACADCNLRKSSDLTGFDPLAKTLTPLFHPRADSWDDHFRWEGAKIVGLTPVGRTTVVVLQLNSSARLRVRMAIRHEGEA